MKKFILLGAALFACGALYAEKMQFVTLLSSPLGVFNRLETADPDVATKSKRVNFCTTKVATGEIRFERVSPSIDFLNLADGTTLTGALTNYYTTNRFDLADGGTVKGKALLARKLTYESGPAKSKSNVSDTMTVRDSATFKGGYAEALDIPNTARSVDSSADTLGKDLHWSNTYQCEAYDVNGVCPTGKNATRYAKSFVLKSSNAASCVGPNGSSYTESCGTGYTGSITYTWNTSTCKYDKKDTCKAKEEVQWGCFTNGGYSKMLRQTAELMQDGRYMDCEYTPVLNCDDYLTDMNLAACRLLNDLEPGYEDTPTATAICKKQCGEDTPCEGRFYARIGKWGHSSETSFSNAIPFQACSNNPSYYHLVFNVYCYIDTEGLGNFMCPDNFPL